MQLSPFIAFCALLASFSVHLFLKLKLLLRLRRAGARVRVIQTAHPFAVDRAIETLPAVERERYCHPNRAVRSSLWLTVLCGILTGFLVVSVRST